MVSIELTTMELRFLLDALSTEITRTAESYAKTKWTQARDELHFLISLETNIRNQMALAEVD